MNHPIPYLLGERAGPAPGQPTPCPICGESFTPALRGRAAAVLVATLRPGGLAARGGSRSGRKTAACDADLRAMRHGILRNPAGKSGQERAVQGECVLFAGLCPVGQDEAGAGAGATSFMRGVREAGEQIGRQDVQPGMPEDTECSVGAREVSSRAS